MKLNAAVKVGLITGLVVSLCLQITAFLLFYERAYLFTVPAWAVTLINIICWPVILVTVVSQGPAAVRAAGDAVRGWRGAALVGGGAGLICAVVVYLLVGALAHVMVLGVVPLIVPLSDSSNLAITPVDQLLRPVLQQAVVQLYTSLFTALLSWAAFSAVTGIIFVLVRPHVRPLFVRKAKSMTPAAG